jgi:hypothetical protein
MSPATGNPHAPGRKAPKAKSFRKSRTRLSCACALLLAAAATALLATRVPFAKTPDRNEATPQIATIPVNADRASVSLCPGSPTRVNLSTNYSIRVQLNYRWFVNGGTISGDGDKAVWELGRAKPGTYTATLRVTVVRQQEEDWAGAGSVSVTVKGCEPVKPPCPPVSLSCPQQITAGDRLSLKTALRGDTSDVKPVFEWRASAGKLVSGNGTPEILLDTTGVSESSIKVRVLVSGFDQPCRAECAVLVVRRFDVITSPTTSPTPPTPTPTLTPTPTPTRSPTPSPTPLPTASPSASPVEILGVTPEPSPTPSPGASPSPSPSTSVVGAQDDRSWLVILAVLALLATLAAGFFLLKKLAPAFSKGFAPGAPPPPSETVKFKEASAGGALIIGGQEKVTDEVHCTVYSPERAAPGDPFLVQVFAHLADQADRLAAIAARADEAAREQGSKLLSEPVARGEKLTFVLEMQGLNVYEPKQSLVWRGVIDYVQFAVDVPEDSRARPVRGVVRIYYGEEHAPVGQIMFMFRVAAAGEPATPPATTLPEQKLVRFTHAFVSYCSADRLRVLTGLQGLQRGWKRAGITYFIDLQGIGPGEGWREEIKKNLDRCDLFVLFWSTAAKCSEEVRREVQYALARKGGDDGNPPAFEPFTIEMPLPLPLPDGLESLHFGDEMLHLIKAEEALAPGGVESRATTRD